MECGEKAISSDSTPRKTRLQRSRTRWSAESRAIGSELISHVLASTEPHSLECGESTLPQVVEMLQGASTEPHSLECGERARMRCMALPPPSFNGAALVGVRREKLGGDHEEKRWASTEPHSLECGEVLNSGALGTYKAASTEPHSLECGEELDGEYGAEQRLASTEPHSLECGEDASDFRHDAAFVASTEPHSLECGEVRCILENSARLAASTEPHSLECGEFSSSPECDKHASMLQRSRTRWSAESTVGQPEWLACCLASTEPHSLECGEFVHSFHRFAA